MPPCFIYTIYFEMFMKRKITYLLKDFDQMTKLILSHTTNIKNQSELLKRKEEIFQEINKMSKKYDKILEEVENESEEDYEK